MKCNINLLHLSILFLTIENTVSILDFTYPSAIGLLNKNIFIVEKEGFYVYDENLQNIIYSYPFQEEREKINNLDILSKVRIVSKGNFIVCLVNRKIYFFDYEGKLFSKTDELITEEIYYYPALTFIPIDEGNCYYYTISYFIGVNGSYKQRVLYYKLSKYDKINYPINELTLNEFESKKTIGTDSYDFNNMGLSCEYMQSENEEEYKYLVCFCAIKKSNKISLANNYFELNSNSISKNLDFKADYIDNINELREIQSVVKDDRKKSLVCLLYTNGELNCYNFYFKYSFWGNTIEFNSLTSFNFNCRNVLYGMKLDYINGGQKISLSCINPVSTVQAIFFNNNLDLINSDTHTQFAQCQSIYGHSIINNDISFLVISDVICYNYKTCFEPLDGELMNIKTEGVRDCSNIKEKCYKCGWYSSQKNLCLKCNNNKNYYYLNNFPSKPVDKYIECINESKKPSNFYLNKVQLDYEPCYSTCTSCEYGGNSEENNCTSCDGVNYIKDPENENSKNCVVKCRYFYYMENDIYTCTSIPYCPENQNYLIKEKSKCINDCLNDREYKYRYNGECFKQCPNNTKDDNDFICKDEQNHECFLTKNELYFFNENITFEDIENLVVKYIDEFNYTNYHVSLYTDGNYTITIYIQNECILDLGLGIPKIDFGSCYEKIKKNENFTNEELIIVIIDKKIDSKNNKKVIKYGIFSSLTGKYLNSSEICNEDKITLIESLENKLLDIKIDIQTLKDFVNKGIDLFDMSSPFYNDVCFKYNSKKDIALKDRVLEYFPNITLCEEGCDLLGINMTTITAICECFFSEAKREENLKDKVLEQAQIGFIEDIINRSNIYVIKCFKSILKKDYFMKCYGAFIILFLIFIEIICTIIYCTSSINSITKYIMNIAYKYINYLSEQNKEEINFKINNKNKIKENSPIYTGDNKIKHSPPNHNNSKKLKIKRTNKSKFKRYLTIQKKALINKNYNIIINPGKDSILTKKQNNINIFPYKGSSLNEDLSNSSGKILHMENKHKLSSKHAPGLIINKNSKTRNNMARYLETELDEMDYDEAIRKDRRKFCRCYTDRLKDNNIIINIFCSNDPIRPKPIKIIFLVLQLDLYFFINGIFYNEEYISKIYHLEKDTILTMLSRLFDNLIYATLASIIINYIIEFYFIEEKKIKKILKVENKNTLELKNELIKILKSIKTRYLLFIITAFIISLLSIFHILCFNIVYYHTMFEWIFFSVIIILFIQILSFLICFFQTCLRFISFKFKSEKLFKLSV